MVNRCARYKNQINLYPNYVLSQIPTCNSCLPIVQSKPGFQITHLKYIFKKIYENLHYDLFIIMINCVVFKIKNLKASSITKLAKSRVLYSIDS